MLANQHLEVPVMGLGRYHSFGIFVAMVGRIHPHWHTFPFTYEGEHGSSPMSPFLLFGAMRSKHDYFIIATAILNINIVQMRGVEVQSLKSAEDLGSSG
jgi:hypothetical protein